MAVLHRVTADELLIGTLLALRGVVGELGSGWQRDVPVDAAGSCAACGLNRDEPSGVCGASNAGPSGVCGASNAGPSNAPRGLGLAGVGEEGW